MNTSNFNNYRHTSTPFCSELLLVVNTSINAIFIRSVT